MTNDLTFSGQVPVIINKNGSASDIFAPVRSSSCDINIVSPELLSDIYTEKKDEIKVKIEKDFYDKVETIINHPAEIEHIMVRPGWIENKVVIPAWDEEVVHSDGWGIMDVKTVDLKLNSFAPFKDIDGEWWWYDFYNKQWCMFDPTSDTMNADVNANGVIILMKIIIIITGQMVFILLCQMDMIVINGMILRMNGNLIHSLQITGQFFHLMYQKYLRLEMPFCMLI